MADDKAPVRVVVGIALCLLLLLAIVEFLGGERHDGGRPVAGGTA